MPDASALSLREIADGVNVWIGRNGDSNAGAVVVDDGVVVIDAQQTLALGRQFRASLEKAAVPPICALVNTHFHLDHTAGNEAFAGMPILAHRRTMDILTDYLGPLLNSGWSVRDVDTKLKLFFGSNIRELVAHGSSDEEWFLRRMSGPDYAEIALRAPTQLFADCFAFRRGDDELRLDYYGPAHSDGDLVVWLPRAKVAFLGDLMFHGRFPWLGDCDIDGWIACLTRILALDLDAVVPGHGPVVGLPEVASFRDLLSAIRGAASAAVEARLSEDDAVKQTVLDAYADMPRYREWMPFNFRAAYRYVRSKQSAGRAS